MPPRTLVPLAALLLLALGAGRAAADPPKAPAGSDRFRQALDQVGLFDKGLDPGTKLTDLFDILRAKTGLHFATDDGTGDDNSTLPDFTSLEVSYPPRPGVKLRTALKNLLGAHGLTFVYLADEDVVFISTRERAWERQCRQSVGFEFEKVTLERALRQLARETGVNLLLDPRQAAKAKETLNLAVDDVPLETAVGLLAELVGLHVARAGNTLLVTSQETADRFAGSPEPWMEVGPRPATGSGGAFGALGALGAGGGFGGIGLTSYPTGAGLLGGAGFGGGAAGVTTYSFRFHQTPLEQALRRFGRDTNTNVVLDQRQAEKGKQPVTLRLDNARPEVAARLLAEVVGLQTVWYDNVLFVTSKEVAAEFEKELAEASRTPADTAPTAPGGPAGQPGH
jgi:hypothetical protein